jgi:hypothetical protein
MARPFGRTIAQLARQEGPPPMETRTHRADRAAQRRRRVHVAQFVKVAEDDGLAIPDRQGDDRPPKRFKMAPAIEIADRIDFDRKRCGSSLRLVVKRQRGPNGAGAASVVAGDAEQPELHRRSSRPIAPRAVDDGDERFVNDVLGGGVRAAHVSGKPAGVGVMTAVELGERFAIAFGNSSDQQVVWQRGFAHITIQSGGEKSSRHLGSGHGWNFFGSILVLTRKRSKVVSSIVSAPSARRRRKGHFMPSTSR